jgi:integrase
MVCGFSIQQAPDSIELRGATWFPHYHVNNRGAAMDSDAGDVLQFLSAIQSGAPAARGSRFNMRGEGRIVPLSQTAARCLQEWRSKFPDAHPAHYLFPSERYGLVGQEGRQSGKAEPFDVKPDEPIGSWKVSWTAARAAAKVFCRWHDMRHTFVSKMAEGQASDATIMSPAGHLSRKMMEKYSHTRNEAKRQAISALDDDFPSESTQNPPQ